MKSGVLSEKVKIDLFDDKIHRNNLMEARTTAFFKTRRRILNNFLLVFLFKLFCVDFWIIKSLIRSLSEPHPLSIRSSFTESHPFGIRGSLAKAHPLDSWSSHSSEQVSLKFPLITFQGRLTIRTSEEDRSNP